MTGKEWCPEKGPGNAKRPPLGPLQEFSLSVSGKCLLQSTLVVRHHPVAMQA